MDDQRNRRVQINLLENDEYAEQNAQAAAGRPRAKANPSSVFTGLNEEGFKVDLDEKPVRDTGNFGGIEGRQTINIDENEDTLHTKADFAKILNRGKRLQTRMDEAMGDDAWEKLHGANNLPKRYVPPFLRGQDENAAKKAEEFKKNEQ